MYLRAFLILIIWGSGEFNGRKRSIAIEKYVTAKNISQDQNLLKKIMKIRGSFIRSIQGYCDYGMLSKEHVKVSTFDDGSARSQRPMDENICWKYKLGLSYEYVIMRRSNLKYGKSRLTEVCEWKILTSTRMIKLIFRCI